MLHRLEVSAFGEQRPVLDDERGEHARHSGHLHLVCAERQRAFAQHQGDGGCRVAVGGLVVLQLDHVVAHHQVDQQRRQHREGAHHRAHHDGDPHASLAHLGDDRGGHVHPGSAGEEGEHLEPLHLAGQRPLVHDQRLWLVRSL